MTPRYTRIGKQVLRDGAHMADGADETAAEIITLALNTAALLHHESEQARAAIRARRERASAIDSLPPRASHPARGNSGGVQCGTPGFSGGW